MPKPGQNGRMSNSSRLSAGLHVLVATALGVALIAGGPDRLLPVTATFGGVTTVFSAVSLGWAVVVLSLAVAIGRVIPGRLAAVATDSQLAGITVFLVAQLNGITEVTSLVPLYAIAAGATLFLPLMERERTTGGTGRTPFMLGAAVGIVPWGVIAFAQIGGILTGHAPDATARVITLVALALAALHWAAVWRGAPRGSLLAALATVVALGAAALL